MFTVEAKDDTFKIEIESERELDLATEALHDLARNIRTLHNSVPLTSVKVHTDGLNERQYKLTGLAEDGRSWDYFLEWPQDDREEDRFTVVFDNLLWKRSEVDLVVSIRHTATLLSRRYLLKKMVVDRV